MRAFRICQTPQGEREPTRTRYKSKDLHKNTRRGDRQYDYGKGTVPPRTLPRGRAKGENGLRRDVQPVPPDRLSDDHHAGRRGQRGTCLRDALPDKKLTAIHPAISLRTQQRKDH